MVSVYKRGKGGVYYMDFTFHGQRVFKSTGCFNKPDARDKEAEERRKLRQELMTPESQRIKPLLLSQAIERAYKEVWVHNKDGERTFERVKRVLKFIPDKPITEISNDDISSLINGLLGLKVKYSTVNRYLSHLKTVFNLSLRKWKATSVIPYIQIRKEPKTRLRIISRKEEAGAIWMCRKYKYRELLDIIRVLADTGMRLGNLLTLEAQDVDFNTGLISIWKNKADEPYSIPMTKRARRVLLRRLKGGHKRFFTISKSWLEHQWQKVRKDMGLEKDGNFVIHTLRHTFASRLVAEGADLYDVKELLGHSTIQVTERYAHLRPEKLRGTVEILEKKKRK